MARCHSVLVYLPLPSNCHFAVHRPLLCSFQTSLTLTGQLVVVVCVNPRPPPGLAWVGVRVRVAAPGWSEVGGGAGGGGGFFWLG